MKDKDKMVRKGMEVGPVKVLQLISSLPVGGAEEVVAAIVRGLDPVRFQVQAATIGSLGAVGEELAWEGHRVLSLGLDLKKTSFFHLAAAVGRLIREVRPDILHTHLYHPNLYGRLAALGLGLKGVVASVHNSYNRVKLHRCLWNLLLGRLTDKVLVSSSRVWRDVRTWDRVPVGKLQVFPYGVRLQDLDIPLTPVEARAGLGVGGFVLGVVARLEEQKGLRHLLAALPELCREMPDLTVMVVGTGREEEALKRQAAELGVGRRVVFLGARRDLPRIFRALDLYVQPSLWEGLPLAVLMAMGAGLPVVGTRVSGLTELIEDGATGRLAPPGDSRALAAAIRDLYGQPQRRASLGQAAREKVAAHYSQEAMLRRLEAIYEEILAR